MIMKNVTPERRIRTSYSISTEVHRKSAVDAGYKAYCDSVSDQELEEEKPWAEFGTAQMAELSK